MNAPVFSSVMPSLPVTNLDEALIFYTGTLGFTLDFRNGATFAIVARDAIQLGLSCFGDGGAPAGTGRCYCKLAEGIDALYAGYVARSVSIRHELRDESYGMREFMIADPDQNELNFGQPMRGSNRN